MDLVAAAPKAYPGLSEYAAFLRIDLAKEKRLSMRKADRCIKMKGSRKRTVVWIKEEKITTIADDHGSSVDVPHSRLLQDCSRMAQRIFVLCSPVEPVTYPG